MTGRPYGPHLFEVCDACNYNKHICHFCGEDLRHDERLLDGSPNPCYEEALKELAQQEGS